MADLPAFASFYDAVSGQDPFPWQLRLAEQVIETGWPSEIGVPTGLGKTSCIDICVWALAMQADMQPEDRMAPTRTWYVVNRRLLVDNAWSHGRALAEMFRAGTDARGERSQTIRRVAEALASLTPLGAKDGPLQITRLRGGAELSARPLEPSQPAIIFATVPMFASRWLFRGYGTSRAMRPVDAALAGIDSLVLLDEAHLARPLLALRRTVAECDIGDPSTVVNAKRSRLVMVALTATGEAPDDRFDLDESDLKHPVVRQRVEASKRTALHETSEKSLARNLAERALESLDSLEEASRCVVFVNTPRTARSVVHELKRLRTKRPRGCEVLMATGRMRGREADAVRKRLLDPVTGAPAGRPADLARMVDLVVVATQTLEVGADLDFDTLVTETPGTRALIQRLGRLNRLGDKPHASGAILHPSDRKTPWAVYGEEPLAVWEALNARSSDGWLDLSPSKLGEILGPPRDEPPRVGELLHAHLWEWAKTSQPSPGEAPVGLFFEGFEDDVPRVSVCWRAHLPEDGVRLFPSVREAEWVELPLWELREALASAGLDEVRRLSDDRASLETVRIEALRPGDEIVLPVTLGLYDPNGWNADARAEVLDTSVLHAKVLPLSRKALANLAPGFDRRDVLDGLTHEGEEGLSKDEEDDLVVQLLDHLRNTHLHPWLEDEEWRGFIDGLAHEVMRPVDDVPFLAHRRTTGEVAEARAEAFEELSFDVNSVALADHLGVVGETASRIARSIGVDKGLIDSLEAAGNWHDLGKRDTRFQRWLHPEPDPAVPRAKSNTPRHLIERERISAGWPRGGRHELLSARILSEWIAARSEEALPWSAELVLHLVSTHHGHGRPLVSVVDDPSPPSVAIEIEGTELEIAADLAEPDWLQPTRFRSLCGRHGYWGLALLEAIVRQADQVASRARAV